MAKAPDLSELRLRTGGLLSANKGILLTGHKILEAQDRAHTFAFIWNRGGEWDFKALEWSSGTCAAIPPENKLSITVGEDGDYFVWGDSVEQLNRMDDRVIVSSVKAIDGSVYSVGMSSHLYRYNVSGKWSKIPLRLNDDVSFEGVAGFSSDEIYGVGWKGMICQIKEGDAKLIGSPTNVILNDACCGTDGFIYSCGLKGILIRGRGQSWEVIEHDITQEDFWSIACFQGSIYISSALFLYRLRGNILVQVKFGDELPMSFYHISTFNNTYMWSIGPNDLMGFDGDKWERIL